MNFQKCDFEITVDHKKKLPVGRIFSWVLRAHIFMGPHGGPNHFPTKSGPKNKNEKIITISSITHQQSIDTYLLISHNKFQPNWPKNG